MSGSRWRESLIGVFGAGAIRECRARIEALEREVSELRWPAVGDQAKRSGARNPERPAHPTHKGQRA